MKPNHYLGFAPFKGGAHLGKELEVVVAELAVRIPELDNI